MYFEDYGELEYLDTEYFYAGDWEVFDSAYAEDDLKYDIVISGDKRELRFTNI